jgi:hypothetical protein
VARSCVHRALLFNSSVWDDVGAVELYTILARSVLGTPLHFPDRAPGNILLASTRNELSQFCIIRRVSKSKQRFQRHTERREGSMAHAPGKRRLKWTPDWPVTVPRSPSVNDRLQAREPGGRAVHIAFCGAIMLAIVLVAFHSAPRF